MAETIFYNNKRKKIDDIDFTGSWNINNIPISITRTVSNSGLTLKYVGMRFKCYTKLEILLAMREEKFIFKFLTF